MPHFFRCLLSKRRNSIISSCSYDSNTSGRSSRHHQNTKISLPVIAMGLNGDDDVKCSNSTQSSKRQTTVQQRVLITRKAKLSPSTPLHTLQTLPLTKTESSNFSTPYRRQPGKRDIIHS